MVEFQKREKITVPLTLINKGLIEVVTTPSKFKGGGGINTIEAKNFEKKLNTNKFGRFEILLCLNCISSE